MKTDSHDVRLESVAIGDRDTLANLVELYLPPASDDPEACDIAEFFILRRHRRSGVGSVAACLAWDRFPRRWTVRVSLGNKGALPFWEETIRAYTNDGATASHRPGSPHDWRVFSFESRRSSSR